MSWRGESGGVQVCAPSEETSGMWLVRHGDSGPVLSFTQGEWDAFTVGVNDNEFDLEALGG